MSFSPEISMELDWMNSKLKEDNTESNRQKYLKCNKSKTMIKI